MGSELLVVVVGASDPGELAAGAHVFLSELEQHWSRFISSSDITRLNLAGGRPNVVAPSCLTLVATMLAAHEATGGAFDPTILPTLVADGYGASRHDPQARTSLPDQLTTHPSLREIVIDADAGTVQLPVGMVLDAGGIGKGLAADLAVDWLLQHGADGALVNIGGDLSVAGAPPSDDGWVVAVELPDSDDLLCTFVVDGGGVATSSTRSRRWQLDGREHHHVVDPRTRRQSTTDLATATVIAPNGWAAEAHATGALLAGSEGALRYLAEHQLDGITVALDGSVRSTPALADTIHRRSES
jgi:thiamine biosynthesis lipoprotein